MSKYYILNPDHSIREAEHLEWAKWFEGPIKRRRVALTKLAAGEISTVFLGLDHRIVGDGHPLLFETMVFDQFGNEQGVERCSTWEEAVLIHTNMVHKWE